MPRVLSAAGVLTLLALRSSAAEGAATGGSEPRPVVVELFTSQGCSSCPGADALLSAWGGEQFRRGRVIPLSYDVDYWDYLGWKDAFSQPAHSERQRRYAAALGVGVYTPQLVVAGRHAFVGSDAAALEAALARLRPAPPKARLRLTLVDSPRVAFGVEARPEASGTSRLRVMLALFENALYTDVRSGENGGARLRNDFVVRRLVDLGPLPADGARWRRAFEDRWDPSWQKERSGAAVFLQDPDTLEIFDAASLYPLR